jgi:hypothetical protein
MAKLLAKPYPGDFGFKPGEASKEYFQRTDALEKALPWERIMTFPVADGKACYLVVSESPFTLQHIPVGDAWQITSAHIRGLRLADWKRQQSFRAFWNRETKKKVEGESHAGL